MYLCIATSASEHRVNPVNFFSKFERREEYILKKIKEMYRLIVF